MPDVETDTDSYVGMTRLRVAHQARLEVYLGSGGAGGRQRQALELRLCRGAACEQQRRACASPAGAGLGRALHPGNHRTTTRKLAGGLAASAEQQQTGGERQASRCDAMCYKKMHARTHLLALANCSATQPGARHRICAHARRQLLADAAAMRTAGQARTAAGGVKLRCEHRVGRLPGRPARASRRWPV